MAKGKQQKPAFAVGDSVKFIGYSEQVPEEDQLLTVDSVYEVVDVDADEESVVVEIDNPDFNPKKKESESNSRVVRVDVFFDEIELHSDDEGAGGSEEAAEAEKAEKAAAKPAKAAAKTAAKPAKAAAKTATKPVAKGKAAAKGKPVAKGKAAAKGKEVENEEADPYPALDEEDGEILELINGADLIELAQEVAEDSAAMDYKLGGILYHIRLDKAYQEVDPQYAATGGFGLFIKDKLNIEYRKAMYLIDIYYKFNLFGIDAEKVRELGWTKCSRIASVMTEDNAEELVELAEESTLADLADTIKESYSRATASVGEKRKKITFKFRLWEDQADSVRAILDGVTEQMGFKDPADAFEHIVVEWAAEHFEATKKSKAKTRASKSSAAATASA